MPQWDEDELEEMGSTFRPGFNIRKRGAEQWSKAVANALKSEPGPTCHRLMVSTLDPDEAGYILDFGCGVGSSEGAVHVRALRELGYDCIGYEWVPLEDDESDRAVTYWDCVEEDTIDPEALDYTYDTVLANNLLNIQPSWDAMFLTLEELKDAMDKDTRLIINMPTAPHRLFEKGRAGLDQTQTLLEESFGKVVELEPGLWACYRPKKMSERQWASLLRRL